MKKNEFPLVIIHWVDNRQTEKGSWRYLADVQDPAPVVCASVGWLIRKTDEYRMLCPTIGDLESEEPQGLGIITIPNSSVVNAARLTEVPSSSDPSKGQASTSDGPDALTSSIDRLKKVSAS